MKRKSSFLFLLVRFRDGGLPALLPECFCDDPLDLAVDATVVVRGPFFQGREGLLIYPQYEGLLTQTLPVTDKAFRY